MAKKYNLTETQIRHLAIICFREQGSNEAGVRACASQMCNYYEKYHTKHFKDVYECTFGSGWYLSKEKNDAWVAAHPNVPAKLVTAVKEVIVDGHRTVPEFVDEYDQLKDVKLIINDGRTYTMERDRDYVLNRANYIPNKTIIQNIYAENSYDRYTFFCFPDGAEGTCDAFGYISLDVGTKTDSEASQKVTGVSQVIEKAVSWMEGIARDNTHGYDQQYRWNERGDYDCSSLVISAWQQAGVPVKTKGATYTGNMLNVFKTCGFVDVTKSVNLATGEGMQRGDVLLNTVHHTAMYCGKGLEVEASGNEYGRARGGKSGDQTGREITIRRYRNYPWNHVLRYTGENRVVSIKKTEVQLSQIKRYAVGYGVAVLQSILNLLGYVGSNGKPLTVDGEFGMNTASALMDFQKAAGLAEDGVCGSKTWKKLKDALKV